MKLYVNPSDPSAPPSGAYPNSIADYSTYPYSYAIQQTALTGYVYNTLVCSAETLNFGQYLNNGSDPPRKVVGKTFDRHIKDGASNTAAFSENLSVCKDSYNNFAHYLWTGATGNGPSRHPSRGGTIYLETGYPMAVFGATRDVCVAVVPPDWSSWHYQIYAPRPGSLLVGMADGSVRSLGSGANKMALLKAWIPNDGETGTSDF